jgi:hypothetical protein
LVTDFRRPPARFNCNAVGRRSADDGDFAGEDVTGAAFGHWKHAGAVPHPARVAREPVHNGRTAAVLALNGIPADEARSAIEEPRKPMGRGYEWRCRRRPISAR